MHTVAEMLGFCFAEVADSTEKIVEGIVPIIDSQLIGVVVRYVNETNCALYWQLQRACPSFDQIIVYIVPSDLECTEGEKSIPVEQYG